MRKVKINERQSKLLKEIKAKKYKITSEQYHRLIEPITESVKQTLNEDIFNSELHQAVLKLIHDLYNNPSQAGLDGFWRRNGLTWGDLFQGLTAMGLLISLPTGAYKIANRIKGKFFHKPEEAIAAVEEVATKLIQEPKSNNKLRDPDGQILMKQTQELDEVDIESKVNGDDSNVGNVIFRVLVFNGEIALISNKSDELFVFDYADLSYDDFKEYSKYFTPDSEIDGVILQKYINDNIETLPVGIGLQAFNEGDPIVKIDEPLKNELVSLYDKSIETMRILHEYMPKVNETTVAGSSGSGGSSGPFTGPLGGGVIKKTLYPEDELNNVIKEGPVAGSAATGGSSGPYDANALPGIKRDGSFKKIKKTQAEVSTQYPDGDFVEMDACTKLNNNKTAQNGKCSTGAIDNVVKLKKGKGSVISK